MRYVFFLLFLLPLVSQASDTTQTNKDIVRKFYERAFNDHRPREAANLYIGKSYT